VPLFLQRTVVMRHRILLSVAIFGQYYLEPIRMSEVPNSVLGIKVLCVYQGRNFGPKSGVPNFLTLGAVFVGRPWCLTPACNG